MNPDIKHRKRKETLQIQLMLTHLLELVKEIFTNMFKEQEEKILNIVRNGISDTKVRLYRLTQEISYNNIKLSA